MNAPAAIDRHGIGANQPPDPLQAYALHLDDLEEQAKAFLDGSGVENEEQAEDVSRLLSMVRKAANDADDARKAEKKPHDDAAKAVQARWKPILDKADLIATTAKKALAPFLQRKEDEQRAAALAAAQEARELADAAARMAQEAKPDSIEDQAALLRQRDAAQEAAQSAARLDKARPQARGGERAVGLRKAYRAEVVDEAAFARWAWSNRRGECLTFFETMAQRETRGGRTDIPGLNVISVPNVV
jgi:hypothetical protein